MRFSAVQFTYLCASIVTATSMLAYSVNSETIRATPSKSSTTTTTTEARKLRGGNVIRTRTVYRHDNEHQQQHENQDLEGSQHEPLVDPRPHQFLKLRGTGRHGQIQEIEIDVTALKERVHEQVHQQLEEHLKHPDEHHPHHYPHHFYPVSSSSTPHTHIQGQQHVPSNNNANEHINQHSTPPNHQPSSQQQQHQQQYQQQQQSAPTANKQRTTKYEPHHTRIVLPTGLDEHYNHSQFEELHSAPFEIYETAFGESLDQSKDSFPVFIVPEWRNKTGVFSGFSRTATPLVFENMQFLLTWEDVQSASTGVDDDLHKFITDNNFHSTLLIGKAFGPNGKTITFLGLLVSYFQSTQKNVLVPFAKLDHFFDDTSEQHLMSDEVKHLELDALHELLEEKRSNSTTSGAMFYHPAMEITDERKQRLRKVEAIHFRKLYQLLIRRSFLFSFGYADCLKTEPSSLRECLDDTFSIVVKMETTVRGAMDEQIVEELARINDSYHSKVGEACITASGMGLDGVCANFGMNMGAYATATSNFF
jgi:hypothetical protein